MDRWSEERIGLNFEELDECGVDTS